jgi:hypothetical protein
MGDALVVMTVPEEAWMAPPRPDAKAGVATRTIAWRIDPGDVWEPPREPIERYGLNWYENPAARRAHRKAMQESLESFLNERLARLYHMLRTGWWVLGKARVRVVECRPVPEREMRAFVRALGIVETRRRRSKSGRAATEKRR